MLSNLPTERLTLYHLYNQFDIIYGEWRITILFAFS
jgi:hypothetical protein